MSAMSHSINKLTLLTTHDASLDFSLQKALLNIFSKAQNISQNYTVAITVTLFQPFLWALAMISDLL